MKYQQKTQIPKHCYSNEVEGNVRVSNKRNIKICSPSVIHTTVDLVIYAV